MASHTVSSCLLEGLVASSDTAVLRAAYRQAYRQYCCSWSDVHEIWPDTADRAALIEDQAKLETLEFELRLLAPANPTVDPGWPGGWLRGNDVQTPSHNPPYVWRSEAAAREAGVEEIAWSPMCRIAPSNRWVVLDDSYWSSPGDDVLVTGLRVR